VAGDDEVVLRCSFCQKAQADVRKLIAGPAAYICDECVESCNEILDDAGLQVARGARAAERAALQADEYLRMAADLSSTGNHRGAAREIRNAALAALRALAILQGEAAAQWSETKVVVTALEDDPELARLLQTDDRAHILLRVSMDGAVLSAADVEPAAEVAAKLVTRLRAKAAALSRP
jgi:hypothetical protein